MQKDNSNADCPYHPREVGAKYIIYENVEWQLKE